MFNKFISKSGVSDSLFVECFRLCVILLGSSSSWKNVSYSTLCETFHSGSNIFSISAVISPVNRRNSSRSSVQVDTQHYCLCHVQPLPVYNLPGTFRRSSSIVRGLLPLPSSIRPDSVSTGLLRMGVKEGLV